MPNFKLVKNSQLKKSRSRIFCSELFRKFSLKSEKQMIESMKPEGYEDQGYRDEN
ncbi:hypothetical protein K9K85_01050 [Patescibacteria group bacterium]|nr:hypothetical protein [Patescibacteria group bacterium]